MEHTYRWFVGQEVKWKGVKPYIISEFISPAGNVHVTEATEEQLGGHYHVYWTYPSSHGENRPVHHGGPEGFDDIGRVKKQHMHVVHQLMGINVEIPSEDDQLEAEVLQIPGEIEKVGQLGFLAQRAARTLVMAEGVGAISSAKSDLEQMLKTGGLERSRSRNKKRTAEILRQGLRGEQSDLLGSALGSQTLLLLTERDLVDMTIATLARLQDLEGRDLQWRATINRLPGKLAQTVSELHKAQGQVELVNRAMKIIEDPTNPLIGAKAMLQDLKGEPYFTKAQKVLSKVCEAQQFAAKTEYASLINILTEQIEQTAVWKSSLRDEPSPYRIDLNLAAAGGTSLTI